MNLFSQNVVIYGAGISGLSAYELVKEKGGRAIIYDDNPNSPHATNSKSVFNDADLIVLSPGVKGDKDFLLDAKLENKKIISELELASNFCQAQQIAITGTNGKTTTTMLINHILKFAYKRSYAVGNIGVAFSAVADRLDAMETAVIECSSFQLESATTFAPDIAVLLNITDDHLERHKTMEKYISAKANVFLRQSATDKVVYNADDENIKRLVPYMKAEKIPFSMSHPVDGAYISTNFLCYKGEPVIELCDIDFKGKELENALAAVAVCMSENVSSFTVASALSNFARPEFRRAVTAEILGIKIYNDSKATNIGATLSAIESIDGDTVLMLGGKAGVENFDQLFSKLDKKVVAVSVVGDNANEIVASANRNGFCNIEMYDELTEAFEKSIETAKVFSAQNILFSPSSKSFDRYTSYAERGRHFDAIVQKYISKK